MPEIPAVNPFVDDKVSEPRRIEPAIPGLNTAQLQTLLHDFTQLETGTIPRAPQTLPAVRLITSPEPGYGKSHLLGRLFKGLGKRATLVNVRPFQAPETAWLSLLRHTVQELRFPDRSAPKTNSEPPSQLVVLAHGVLSNLLAWLLRNHPQIGKSAEIQSMRKDPTAAYALSLTYPAWPNLVKKIFEQKENFNKLLALFSRHCAVESASGVSWLRFLFAVAFRREEAELQISCLEWLKGEAIEPQDAELLGLRLADRVAWELSSAERNELARNRMGDLCRMAVFFRPFLFCFDQTETYGDHPHLARALGQLVQDMWQTLPNQMTVLTTNLYPWQQRIAPHWERAAQQRLAPELALQGITREQGELLMKNRLTRYKVEAATAQEFMNQEWLSNLFLERRQLPTRGFLIGCQQRWEELHSRGADPVTLPRLEELFAARQRELAQLPQRVVYDENVLLFTVELALRGAGGVLKQDAGEPILTWQSGEHRLRIVLDPGSNWNHWKKVAGESAKQNQETRVCLRTPELPTIPAPGWKVKSEIARVIESGKLRIENLSREELLLAHAAWDLHAEAVGGDISHPPEVVRAFLEEALLPVRERIVGGCRTGGALQPSAPPSARPISSPEVTPPAPEVAPPAPEVAPPAPEVAPPPPEVTPPPPAGDDPLAERIVQAFANFKLQVAVGGRVDAPQLVRYQLHPAVGVKAVSLASRASDLMVQLNLSATPLINAAPGMVTLDIPKPRPDLVEWSVWKDDPAWSAAGPLAFPLGVGVERRLLVGDLAEPTQCHLLVAGSTGSGKSVWLQAMLASLIHRNSPNRLRLIIIDPKLVSFTALEGSPFLDGEIITGVEEAIAVLRLAVEEMESRTAQLKKAKLQNLHQWHARGDCHYPYWVIVFDEFADLILTGKEVKKEFETLVARLAGKARAAGIHLVLATQRPDREVVSGLIKANLQLKVCLRVINGTNSQIVLGEPGAENLLGRGDLLVNLGPNLQRGQALFLTERELAAVAAAQPRGDRHSSPRSP